MTARKDPIPMSRTDHRTYSPDFTGTVFTWDIDKTYLRTDIESVHALVRTVFEFAVDKRELSGTVPLLKGLRRGPQMGLNWIPPIYFVSASPTQLRGVFERKMLLDGVEHDGITLKGQWGLLLKGGFKSLRRQMGYKLGALMRYRLNRPEGTREILFGDDSESDPNVYALYAKIVAGTCSGDLLKETLRGYGEPKSIIEELDSLREEVALGPRVDASFIQLTGKNLAPTVEEGTGMYFVRNPLQSSLLLHEWGHVDEDCVRRVAREVSVLGDVMQSLRDGVERGLFSEGLAQKWAASIS